MRYGVDMLPRLNGIFAFTLWDKRNQNLFMARDGVGVKPLYYTETDKGFLFASEMKALLQEPSVDRSLNLLSIHYHLTVAEGFFQRLKHERVKRKTYPTREAARQDIFDYIEMFCNPARKHGYNGNLSPGEFERRYFEKLNSD